MFSDERCNRGGMQISASDSTTTFYESRRNGQTRCDFRDRKAAIERAYLVVEVVDRVEIGVDAQHEILERHRLHHVHGVDAVVESNIRAELERDLESKKA